MKYEDYLSEVERIISENFRANDPSGGMTAARAGFLVRQTLETTPEQVGLSKFRDALDELARRNRIRVGANSKDALAIWLPDRAAMEPADGESVSSAGQSPAPPFLPRLRNSLWLAFVSESPVGKRYLHRQTGHIVVGREAPPSSEGWIEIPAVTPETEKAAADRFVQENNLDGDEDLQTALQSDTWYKDFPERLKQIDDGLSRQWNRSRSQRVHAIVEPWRQSNDIPANLIYEPETEKQQPNQRGREASRSDNAGDLRSMLLQAIDRMSVDELMELRIPARYLIAALRPDLLNG